MKRHKIFVICLAAMVCLVGCGGNSKGDTAEAGTNSSNADMNVTAMDENSEITETAGEEAVAILSDEPYVKVKEENYKDGKIISTITYDYDGNGELIRENYTYEKDPESSYYQDITTTLTEDGGKRVVYEDGILASNGQPCKFAIRKGWEYQYDAEGREVFFTDDTWEVTSEYDGNGNLVKKISKKEDIVFTSEYEYDENGYLIKESSYNSYGELTGYKIFENDKDGREIHQRVFEADGTEPNNYPTFEWIYEYDEKGRVIVEYRADVERGGKSYQKKFSYDDNGRISKEYDSYNNEWITYMPLSQYLDQAEN
ncbi:MAG: hypothetical protein Q4E24_15225 [bacterium]|nr:hypothetical protein [bacterium]